APAAGSCSCPATRSRGTTASCAAASRATASTGTSSCSATSSRTTASTSRTCSCSAASTPGSTTRSSTPATTTPTATATATHRKCLRNHGRSNQGHQQRSHHGKLDDRSEHFGLQLLSGQYEDSVRTVAFTEEDGSREVIADIADHLRPRQGRRRKIDRDPLCQAWLLSCATKPSRNKQLRSFSVGTSAKIRSANTCG